jgi:hypothetical protein
MVVFMPLSRRQRSALPFLVSGLTVEEAGRQSKVPAATLHRWMEDPEFQDVLDRALNQRLDDALSTAAGVDLSSALSDAVTAAKDALKGRSIRNRLQAARFLWDIALRIKEQKLRKLNGAEHE